ncbi:hypothetical protein ACFPK9_04900 [Rubritalea spongiae]|uniref:Uncharacterized protein n=1 Tax=Rubritalea spongiae TaxID=430797 RepID=A0ABW5E694_9BACT
MSQTPQSEITLTYKFLLILSTLSAVFFCYLYVTKPSETIIVSGDTAIDEESVDEVTEAPTELVNSFEALASNSLPGESAPATQTSSTDSLDGIPLPETPSTADKLGWEETNDRVQHVVTAEFGSESQRVLIEVPVIYQTRGLRLGPDQASEAQRVLRALKIYQQQIEKLHQDGKNIQAAWNSLLLSAQPIEALRADSPSLPQTSANNPALLNENSAQTIKVSK